MTRQRKPLVSVIVPAYNAEQHLDECLSSILAQTHQDLEVIVVDDGSTDRTSSVIEAYARKDHRIEAIRQRNGGVSKARNTGLEHANGEYVEFVDADDLLRPEAIGRQVSLALRTGAQAVRSGIVAFDGKREWRLSPCPRHVTVGTDKAVRLLHSYRLGNQVLSLLLSRRLVEANHIRFDEAIGYGEDMLFLNHVMVKVRQLAFLRDCVYRYRSGQGVSAHPSLGHALDDLRVIVRLDELYRGGRRWEGYLPYRMGLLAAAGLALPSVGRTKKEQQVADDIRRQVRRGLTLKTLSGMPPRLAAKAVLIAMGVLEWVRCPFIR